MERAIHNHKYSVVHQIKNTKERKLLENDSFDSNVNNEDEHVHDSQNITSGKDDIRDDSAKYSDEQIDSEVDTETDKEGILELFEELITEKQTQEGQTIKTPTRFEDLETKALIKKVAK